MSAHFSLLVIAKAPAAGFAKTRLCPPATPEQAAEIAASALLDTLEAVLNTPGAKPVVAMTGELGAAARSAEISRALRGATVIAQRGWDFGAKLANAHADTAAVHAGLPVLQIGMDTPQVSPESLAAAVEPMLHGGRDSVLGPAEDGGWWALGLTDPNHAQVLAGVPMSREDTGELTLRALAGVGLRPKTLTTLSDVDTMLDAQRVAALRPGSRFARAVGAVTWQEVTR
ncbi:TIGR04282 family arsenosugar biosynthesis glycosyltransferase [Amycolatopsis sp. H20-H5]|uniref:TIGR04282 family arsenosugar biosynthesis glycosyltransferase n=1 Tax=Amycolatopsis sp. H20-H5 TaxID=3046309 RepID=UPI002DBC0C9A|nr:DUF2064 domain-containing protein [Amycolatopsis sp. H20-H5]MEC3975192.1 DUF2064 domain-containing protein [Amycolatopsis sp. H20-H5]